MRITRDRVNERLHYNPVSGYFTWKDPIPDNSRETAGSSGKDGVIQIEIDGAAYLAHRLVFLLEDGDFPPDHVDHIDGVRSNNARNNLRKATRSQNTQNAKVRRDNKSGVKGVCFIQKKNKYRVVINKEGVANHIGYFVNLEDATHAAITAREGLHGDFARHS